MMLPFLQLLTVLIGLGIAFWSVSAILVLLAPVPTDPWRVQPVPAESEYVRVSDGVEVFVRHWLPNKDVRQVIISLHSLGGHSGYQNRFGAGMAEAGITYYAFGGKSSECRGFSGVLKATGGTDRTG